MIKLPINVEELDTIIATLKGVHPSLYAKLWTYKINELNKEKKDGVS